MVLRPFDTIDVLCEGQGPSETVQREGFYKMKFYGRGMDKHGNEQIVKGGLNAMKVCLCFPFYLFSMRLS